MADQTYRTDSRPALDERRPAHSTSEIPADVADLAGRRGLGDLLETRDLANPIQRGLISLVSGIGLIVLVVVLGAAVGSGVPGFIVVPVVLGGLAFGVILIMTAIATLRSGFQSFYVYGNGLIHRRNRRLRAVLWTELRDAKRHDAPNGIHLGVLLAPVDAEPILVPWGGDDDRLGDGILDHAERAGCRVTR